MCASSAPKVTSCGLTAMSIGPPSTSSAYEGRLISEITRGQPMRLASIAERMLASSSLVIAQ